MKFAANPQQQTSLIWNVFQFLIFFSLVNRTVMQFTQANLNQPNQCLNIDSLDSSLTWLSQQCPMESKFYNIISESLRAGSFIEKTVLLNAVSEIISESPEDNISMMTALNVIHPLNIFIASADKIKKHCSHNHRNSSFTPRACYFSAANSLFIHRPGNVTDQFIWENFVVDVAHEFRHRAWHVTASQLSGKPTSMVLPYRYAGTEKVLYNQSIEKCMQRIFLELLSLYRNESLKMPLKTEERERLTYFRNSIRTRFIGSHYLVNKSKKYTCENSALASASSITVMLNTGDELLMPIEQLEIIIHKKNKTHVEYSYNILGFIPGLIITFENILDLLRNSYVAEEFDQELDAYLWGCFHMDVHRAFFPELLNYSMAAMNYVLNHPRAVTYDFTPMTYKSLLKISQLLSDDKTEMKQPNDLSESWIRHIYAQFLFMFAETQSTRNEHQTRVKNAIATLIQLNLFVSESYVLLANMFTMENRPLDACLHYNYSAEMHPITSTQSRFKEFELMQFAIACVSANQLSLGLEVANYVLATGQMEPIIKRTEELMQTTDEKNQESLLSYFTGGLFR